MRYYTKEALKKETVQSNYYSRYQTIPQHNTGLRRQIIPREAEAEDQPNEDTGGKTFSPHVTMCFFTEYKASSFQY